MSNRGECYAPQVAADSKFRTLVLMIDNENRSDPNRIGTNEVRCGSVRRVAELMTSTQRIPFER